MRSSMRGVARQRVRLQPRRELDAVLEPAQKEVRVGELALLALGDEAARPQAPQRLQRVRARGRAAPALPTRAGGSARRTPPRGCRLRRSSGPGPRRAPPRPARGRASRPSRRRRVGSTARRHTNGARARRAAASPNAQVAGDGPRPDERRALPGAAPRLVVALGGRQRVHERPARPLGPQAQVDAPDDAVVRRLVERGHEALRDPREVLVQRVGAARGEGGPRRRRPSRRRASGRCRCPALSSRPPSLPMPMTTNAQARRSRRWGCRSAPRPRPAPRRARPRSRRRRDPPARAP